MTCDIWLLRVWHAWSGWSGLIDVTTVTKTVGRDSKVIKGADTITHQWWQERTCRHCNLIQQRQVR